MRKITQYVLLVVSEHPIEGNFDKSGVRHFIQAEVELSRVGEEYQIIAPVPPCCNPQKVLQKLIATSSYRLGAILKWLLKVESSFSYEPFHISKYEESYMDSQPMG